MVKTVGAICNLDCHYCYYLKKEELYPKGTNFRLSDETLERYIIQHIQATPKEIVSFSWRTRRSSTAFKPTARRSTRNGASSSPKKIFISASASTDPKSCTTTTA